MKILAILFLLVLTSCATTKYTDSQIEKVKVDMTTLNNRLSGILYLGEMKRDLSSLTKETYLKYALENQDQSEKEYTKLLLKKNIEILIKGEKRDFVVCVKDTNPLLILCDRANQDKVEKVTQENLKLEDLINEL